MFTFISLFYIVNLLVHRHIALVWFVSRMRYFISPGRLHLIFTILWIVPWPRLNWIIIYVYIHFFRWNNLLLDWIDRLWILLWFSFNGMFLYLYIYFLGWNNVLFDWLDIIHIGRPSFSWTMWDNGSSQLKGSHMIKTGNLTGQFFRNSSPQALHILVINLLNKHFL